MLKMQASCVAAQQAQLYFPVSVFVESAHFKFRHVVMFQTPCLSTTGKRKLFLNGMWGETALETQMFEHDTGFPWGGGHRLTEVLAEGHHLSFG